MVDSPPTHPPLPARRLQCDVSLNSLGPPLTCPITTDARADTTDSRSAMPSNSTLYDVKVAVGCESPRDDQLSKAAGPLAEISKILADGSALWLP